MLPMKHKYIFSFIALLLIMQIGFLFFLDSSQGNFSSAINISGKQRMLLQKIAFSAASSLLIDHTYQRSMALNNLKSSISAFKENHERIIKGDTEQGIGVCLSHKLKKIYFSAPYNINENVKGFLVAAGKVLNEANNQT